MQDDILNKKVEHLENELSTIKAFNRNISATSESQKHTINEYLYANIQLRASLMLAEVDMNMLKKQNAQFAEMIKSLNADKEKLKNKVQELSKTLFDNEVIDGA